METTTRVEDAAPEPRTPAARDLRSKLAWAIGYPVATFLGWVALTGPSNIVWGKRYITSVEGLSAGDHVQLTYYLWLWWHWLTTHSHGPWTDPFQFAATGYTTHQPFGWPLVLVSLPVQAIWGPVAAFNAMMYASIIAAAGSMFLWVRSLNLPRYAAAIAGFAFAFAPFRLAQRSHINSYLSFLVPLAFYFCERALRGEKKGSRLAAWGCALTVVSLCASGEMHMVTYFIPAFGAYVLIRAWGAGWERIKSLLIPAIALGVGSLVMLGITYKVVYVPSVRAAADTSQVPPHYAPRIGDTVKRSGPSERTAYPGAVPFGLAVIGAVVWLRKRKSDKRTLALIFVVGVIGCYVLAMLPAWGKTGLDFYNAIKVLHRIIVPGRIMLIASLLIGLLAAVGAAAIAPKSRWAPAVVAVVAMSLIIWDNSAFTRGIAAATVEPNLTPKIPRGAPVLDLPPFPSGHFFASRYEYEILRDPGPHVGGYSIFSTPDADSRMHLTDGLANLPPSPCGWLRVSKQVHFDYVVVHQVLFGNDHPNKFHKTDGKQLVAAFDKMPGLTRVSTVRDVVTYRFDPTKLACDPTTQ